MTTKKGGIRKVVYGTKVATGIVVGGAIGIGLTMTLGPLGIGPAVVLGKAAGAAFGALLGAKSGVMWAKESEKA